MSWLRARANRKARQRRDAEYANVVIPAHEVPEETVVLAQQEIAPIYLAKGDVVSLNYFGKQVCYWENDDGSRIFDRAAVIDLGKREAAHLGLHDGVAGVFGKKEDA